jgi:hypothetical protein
VRKHVRLIDTYIHTYIHKYTHTHTHQNLATAMHLGLCCWLNARLGIMCANTYVSRNQTSQNTTTILPRCVLGRVLQAMSCADRFFSVIQPYIRQCAKSTVKNTPETSALQDLLGLAPHTVGASLRLLCRVLATIQPSSGNLPALTQMVDLLDAELETAFGCEEAGERGDGWVSVEAVDEPWRSGVTREVSLCVYIHMYVLYVPIWHLEVSGCMCVSTL